MLIRGIVEDLLASEQEKPRLIFTSPPFMADDDLLWEWFGGLSDLVPHGGSVVVTHGNSWEPPNASWATFDKLTMIAGVLESCGLSLHQTFVIVYRHGRMSPVVAERMREQPRAADCHAHAWWLGRAAEARAGRQNVVYADEGPDDIAFRARTYIEGLGDYHAALPLAVPRFFVDLLTDPGDLVLDPFAGTNSTGAAAAAMGRRWLSYEPEPEQIRRACCRPMPSPE
jgi:hypothetical protein